MKRLLGSLIILFSASVFGQNIDLRTQFLTADNDSVRIQLLGKLASSYVRSNPDSAFYFGFQCLTLSKTLNSSDGRFTANNALGNIHFFQSNYDSSIYYWNACLTQAIETNDSLKIGAMLNNIGLIYTYKTQFDTSIYLLMEARKIREKIHDEKVTSTLNNIGNAYQRMSDWNRALTYYLETVEMKKLFNQRQSLTTTLNNIGIVLKNMGKPTDAIPYYTESIALAIEFNDRISEANAHNNLASLYHDSPDLFKLAGKHYARTIEIKIEMNDKAGLANSYANYADWLSEMGNSNEALQYMDKAEKLSKEVGLNLYSSKIHLLKSSILFRLGRSNEAYEEISKAYNIKVDELTSERNDKIAELETKYESVKKEAEIRQLQLSGELKDANLLRARNAQYAMGIGGISIFIILAIFFTFQYKKEKAEREAQELQVEALKKRFMELHASPSQLAVEMHMAELNRKLHTPLTEREFDALKLSIEGKSNTEIADKLFISVSTVKFHLRNAYSKMGVVNRKEAFQFMLKSS